MFRSSMSARTVPAATPPPASAISSDAVSQLDDVAVLGETPVEQASMNMDASRRALTRVMPVQRASAPARYLDRGGRQGGDDGASHPAIRPRRRLGGHGYGAGAPDPFRGRPRADPAAAPDRKSTRLNSSHVSISYA